MRGAFWLAAAHPFVAVAENFPQVASEGPAALVRAPAAGLLGSSSDAFTRLPIEVAQQVQEVALNLAWFQANDKFGPSDRAQYYQNAAEASWASMKSLSKDLFDDPDLDNFVDGFRWLALAVSQYTADFLKSGATGMDRVKDHLQQLESIQELDAALVQSMYQMCWGAAWFASNNITGHKPESLSNFTSFQEYSRDLATDTLLHDVDFEPERGKVTHDIETRLVAEQTLHNGEDSDQVFHVVVQYPQGFTDAFLGMPGVRIDIDAVFQAGFHYDVFEKGTLSTELLFNATLGTKITGVVRNFTIPVTVHPNTTVYVTASVEEAILKVPITMNVSCASKHWTYSGTWKGAARSRYTYDVKTHPPDSISTTTTAQIVDDGDLEPLLPLLVV